MIRTIYVALVSLVLTVRFGIPILVRAARRSPRLDQTCRINPRRWAAAILGAAGVRVEIEGEENLPAGAPAILVANHQSWFDVFTLAAHFPRDYRFVAKKELESVPIFGPAWQACGHVSIDRADLSKAIAALQVAGRIVREGAPVVIMFPEGTRSPTGELQSFKKGAFVLAIQVGVPIVPAAILGTREVMPKGSWRIRSGRVRVRIGAPIPVAGLAHDDREALSRVARGAIARLKEGAPLHGPWESVAELRGSNRSRTKGGG